MTTKIKWSRHRSFLYGCDRSLGVHVLKIGIEIPNLRTCIPGDRSHPYRKDRWRLHFIFVIFQVERKTVMTWCIKELCWIIKLSLKGRFVYGNHVPYCRSHWALPLYCRSHWALSLYCRSFRALPLYCRSLLALPFLQVRLKPAVLWGCCRGFKPYRMVVMYIFIYLLLIQFHRGDICIFVWTVVILTDLAFAYWVYLTHCLIYFFFQILTSYLSVNMTFGWRGGLVLWWRSCCIVTEEYLICVLMYYCWGISDAYFLLYKFSYNVECKYQVV